MSKLSKLKRDPKLFFRDSAKKRLTQILVSLDKKENTEKVTNKNNLSQRKTTVSEKSVGSGATNKKAVKSTDNSRIEVPGWYQPNISRELQNMMNSTDKPVFLYLPWIAEHGNILISKILSEDYDVLPFDLAKGIDPLEKRRDIFRFAKNYPDIYKKMVYKRLVPLAKKVEGFIFTFDWAPVMRIIVQVCNDLDIKTILVPHESVFVDRSKYYWDPYANASVPICDIVLCWGSLQKDIFVERGYPVNDIHIVGAPKFDSYFNYSPQLTRKQYYQLFGLDPNKKTILFASQPLDSQLDIRVARNSQRQAINDIYNFVQLNNMQLIIRLPPSSDNILTRATYKNIQSSSCAAIDDSLCYVVGPEETIYHNDIIASVNSTMLFEGVLAGKFAFSTKYVEFDQIWEKAGIPAVTNKIQLDSLLTKFLHNEIVKDSIGLKWASEQFGVGCFDGKANERIKLILEQLASDKIELRERDGVIDKVIKNKKLDHIGYVASKDLGYDYNEFLKSSFNAQTVKYINPKANKISELVSLELILSISKYTNELAMDASRAFSIPILNIEPLPIKERKTEVNFNLMQQQSCDSLNALRYSFLNSYEKIDTEFLFSSPYQEEPLPKFDIGSKRNNSRTIIIFDSGILTQSINNRQLIDFEDMLQDVVNDNTFNKNIIIIKEPKVKLDGLMHINNTDTLDYMINKYSWVSKFTKHTLNIVPLQFSIESILDEADEVCTLNSIFAVEALVKNIKVKCYMPSIYSNWGITEDKHDEILLKSNKKVDALKLKSWIYSKLIK